MAGPDWAHAQAPSLADFEAMAGAAYADLPPAFRALCDGLLIRVVDLPDDDMLRELDLENPFDLLGLFRGVGLAQGGGLDGLTTGQMPNTVWLFRRPLLDFWADGEDTLGELVTHVLVHEIGHHFGLSDADMEAIEAAAD